jgi:hypothetical protein
MDQLMLGYGVSKSTNGAPPPGYQGDAVLTEPTPAPVSTYGKKELTLKEKQELAAKMENETRNMSGSMSLNSMNKNRDLMTDNLMSKNLADMSIKKPVPSSNSNFDLLTQMSPNNTNTSNGNNFMMMPSPVNNNQFQQPKPAFNNTGMHFNSNNSGFNNFSMNNNGNNNRAGGNNQNGSEFVGIFGNLALPAPPTATGSSTNTSSFMNSSPMMPSPSSMGMGLNVNTTMKPNAMSIPLIPTPPKAATSNLMMPNSNSQSGVKKSAMDDLTDIFG